LAFTEVGERGSAQVLLCLPGLLETSSSFEELLLAARHSLGLRVIAVDYCGRGGSDALSMDSGYTMSLYLTDIEEFIRREVFQSGLPRPKLDLIGTSMGGILGMYLASKPSNGVTGLFLNDIGLSLTWMSIFGLYEGMKVSGRVPDANQLASRLGVTEGVVRDVQSPHHFDLPHRKDWKGMNFGHILSDFGGPVRLIYGSQSAVCLPHQVHDFAQKYPVANLLRAEGASHPVPFTDAVCEFVLQALHLELPSNKVIEPTTKKTIQVQEPLPLEVVLKPTVSSLHAQDTSLPNTILAQAEATDQAHLNTQEVVNSTDVQVERSSNWRSKFFSWFLRSK
jgi:pimeloyl-ACP methyl ester carboxylesterase